MRPRKHENGSDSDSCGQEGFALALGPDETRRQAWACMALSGIILAALLASIFSGTP